MASYFFIVQPIRLPSEDEIIAYHDDIWVKDISPDIKEGGDKFILYVDGEYKLYINGEYAFVINEEEILSNPQFNTIPIYGG